MKKYFQIQVMLAAGGPSGFKWVLEGEKKGQSWAFVGGGEVVRGVLPLPQNFRGKFTPPLPPLKESEKKERKPGERRENVEKRGRIWTNWQNVT